jgi:hypothetical protein
MLTEETGGLKMAIRAGRTSEFEYGGSSYGNGNTVRLN